MASNACSGIASGMVGALFFFYLQDYLGIGNKFAHIQIIALVVSLLGANFWLRAMMRIGKHAVLACCCTATVLTLGAMACIRPGPWAFYVIFGVFAVSAFSSTGFDAAGWSMMADIVDYDTLKSGQRRAGNYFAAMSFVSKINLAAGGRARVSDRRGVRLQRRTSERQHGDAGLLSEFHRHSLGTPRRLPRSSPIDFLSTAVVRISCAGGSKASLSAGEHRGAGCPVT